MSGSPPLTLSIVSHGQGELAGALLQDIARLNLEDVEIILTLNLPEELPFADAGGAASAVKILRNDRPRGFAANHNAAFVQSSGEYFCVLNPDARLPANPFPALLQEAAKREVGVVAPMILDARGECEDSARKFPTFISLLKRVTGAAERLDYGVPSAPFSPDWVAGMFMLFRSEVYRGIGGFDERFFLYYEDVDICRRLRAKGLDVRWLPQVPVTHLAQRKSRRDLRHMSWHLRSMLLYLSGR